MGAIVTTTSVCLFNNFYYNPLITIRLPSGDLKTLGVAWFTKESDAMKVGGKVKIDPSIPSFLMRDLGLGDCLKNPNQEYEVVKIT